MSWPRAVAATSPAAAGTTAGQASAAGGAQSTGTRGSTARTGKIGAVTDTRPAWSRFPATATASGRPALLRHPPGRRGPPVPRGRRASRTRGTARTFRQGAAPRHGRRSPRPWRHDRAVHRCAPPVPDGATARATVTCSPGRPPDGARTRHRRQDKPMSYPQPTYPGRRRGREPPDPPAPVPVFGRRCRRGLRRRGSRRIRLLSPPVAGAHRHDPGTSAWPQQLVVAVLAGAVIGHASWRHHRMPGRRGEPLLLCPLGRRAARRLARTIGGRLAGHPHWAALSWRCPRPGSSCTGPTAPACRSPHP